MSTFLVVTPVTPVTGVTPVTRGFKFYVPAGDGESLVGVVTSSFDYAQDDSHRTVIASAPAVILSVVECMRG